MKHILLSALTIVSVTSFAQEGTSVVRPIVRTITQTLAPMSSSFEGTGSVLIAPQRNPYGITLKVTLGLNVLTAASGCQKFDSARGFGRRRFRCFHRCP